MKTEIPFANVVANKQIVNHVLNEVRSNIISNILNAVENSKEPFTKLRVVGVGRIAALDILEKEFKEKGYTVTIENSDYPHNHSKFYEPEKSAVITVSWESHINKLCDF